MYFKSLVMSFKKYNNIVVTIQNGKKSSKTKSIIADNIHSLIIEKRLQTNAMEEIASALPRRQHPPKSLNHSH